MYPLGKFQQNIVQSSESYKEPKVVNALTPTLGGSKKLRAYLVISLSMVGTLDKELPKNVVGQKVWVTMYANSHIINKARIKSRWNLHFSEQGLEIPLCMSMYSNFINPS